MPCKLTGVNPHMKVLGAAFVTLIRMGSAPLPRPQKREARELAERARACPAATAPGCDEMREGWLDIRQHGGQRTRPAVSPKVRGLL